MKFNKIIFSAVTLSALVFTGCNKGQTEHLWKDYEYVDINYHEKTCYLCKDHPEGHTETEYHHWDDGVLTTKPTHTHKGEITFTCADCGGKRYREVAKLADHVFDRCIVSDETFKEDATCEHPAVYYKSCECGEISKTDTFYHGEKLPHDIKEFKVEGELDKKQYAAYEKVDLTGLTVKYICEDCGEHTVDLDDIVVTYENGTDSFRYINAGTQKVYLHFENQTKEVGGITVNRVDNEITGLEDMEIHCHNQLDLSNVKATYGEVEFSIKDKDGNPVEKASFGSLNHEASPYSITAKVEAGDQYDGAEVTKTITVEHEFIYDDDTGTEVCKCGTAALDCYYYDTTKKAVTTDYITGAYADKFDDQTVIIDEDTGEAPVWEGVEPTFDNYKNLLATFSDGTTCRFRGHAVKDFLTQASDWSKVCVQTTGTAVNGYYVIANDIIGDVNANNAVSDTDIHITLDGAYHKINKITVTGCMFGGCNYERPAYTQVVIKNLEFTSLYMADGARLFGSAGVNATMTTSPYAKFYNVRMLDIDIASPPQSVMCNNGSTHLYKFVNSYFNLSKKDGITFQGYSTQPQIWAMPAFTNTTCVINHTYAHNGINYNNKAAEYKYDEATGEITSYITGLTFIDSSTLS